VGPDYGISVADVYHPDRTSWLSVDGAGGASELEADREVRRKEARYAADWFATITGQVFG
jgi:hypothetical protein